MILKFLIPSDLKYKMETKGYFGVGQYNLPIFKKKKKNHLQNLIQELN